MYSVSGRRGQGGRAQLRNVPRAGLSGSKRGFSGFSASEPSVATSQGIVKKMVQRNGLGRKKERHAVTATERKQHLIVGISTEGSTVSEDGSEFSINLAQHPLHVPPNAFNVGIRLVDLVIPYVWPNFTNSTGEKLKISFEDERDYTLTEVGKNVTGYSVPEPLSSNIVQGVDGQITRKSEDFTNPITGYGDFITAMTQSAKDGFNVDPSATITGLSTVNGTQDFVTHIVWEEKKINSDQYQVGATDVFLDGGFFQVFRKVNPDSGLQELWIRFHIDEVASVPVVQDYRLNANYNWNESNVLTVLGKTQTGDDIKVTVVYNDSVIAFEKTLTVTTARTQTFTWTKKGGSNLIVGFHSLAVATTGVTVRSPGATTDVLELGYVTDGDETGEDPSFYYQHGILMSAYRGNWELRPHVKLQVAGIGSDSGYEAGEVLEIPILHDDDTELTFVTIPTLLGYMQGVINQYVFREFYLTQFLSVDLVENHTGSNGTNYLVQFDYNLARSATVASLDSSFKMDSKLYEANANRMRVKFTNAPYYAYRDPTDNTPDMLIIKISKDGSTEASYSFDFTDMYDIATNNQHATPEDSRDYIIVSRTDVAQFVYESISRALKEEDLANLSPWASRSSQPSTSPLVAFYDHSSTEAMDLDMAHTDATDATALTTSFTFKFKDPNEWVDNDGGAVNDAAYIKIDASALTPDWVQTTFDTNGVEFQSYTPSGTFLGETTINTGGSATLDYSIFNKIDNLTIDVILQDGVYNVDYLNQYLDSNINDFFHSSSHGSSSAQSLVQVRANEFTQQLQIGVLLADNDPGLPSRAEISFPGQNASANNAFAQLLYSGVSEDLENSPFVISAGGESTGALEYTPLYSSNGVPYTSGIVPKPSYDDQNIQLATLDFSRVVSNFRGIRHEIVANDPGSRIFDFNPFSGDDSSDVNKNLKTNTYEIEIPTGSYTPRTLEEMVDYLLHQQNPNIVQDVVRIRELASVQSAQLGALVSGDPNNAFPHKVTFHASDPAPTTFASLVGWDLSAGDVVVEAPDFRETNRTITPNYASYFTKQTNFETRSIFLMSNFSRNATSPDGTPMQIVSAFAPRAQRGENIIISPNQPIINDAGTYLKDNKLDEIRFRLVDGVTLQPLALGTESNDGYTVVLALEYDEQKPQEEIMRPSDYTNLSTGV